jgi:hypothetical protein
MTLHITSPLATNVSACRQVSRSNVGMESRADNWEDKAIKEHRVLKRETMLECFRESEASEIGKARNVFTHGSR